MVPFINLPLCYKVGLVQYNFCQIILDNRTNFLHVIKLPEAQPVYWPGCGIMALFHMTRDFNKQFIHSKTKSVKTILETPATIMRFDSLASLQWLLTQIFIVDGSISFIIHKENGSSISISSDSSST